MSDKGTFWIGVFVLVAGIVIGISTWISFEDLPVAFWLFFSIAGMMIFLLTLRFFKQSLLIWFFVAPFYYLPYYLAPARGSMEFGGPGFWLRAFKDIVILAIILVWLGRLLFIGKAQIRPTVGSVLLLGYISLGFIHSVGVPLDATLRILRLFGEYTIFFFIAQDIFRDEESVRCLLWVWISASIGVSLLGVYEYYTGGMNLTYAMAAGQPRIISTLYNPNALGWYLAWVNSLVLGLFLCGASYNHRRKLVGIFGLNSFVIMLSGSRSSFLSLFLVLFLAVLAVPKKRSILLMTSVFVVGVLSAIFLANLYAGIDQLRVLKLANAWELRLDRITKTLPIAITSIRDPRVGKRGHKRTWCRYRVFECSLLWGILAFILLGIVVFEVLRRLWDSYMRHHKLALPFLLSAVTILLLGFIGSVLTVFPMAMFFWSTAGIAIRLANSKALKSEEWFHNTEVPRSEYE